MALIPVKTVTINQAGDSITLADITGNYSANNTTGYGSPNRARSSNTITDFVITKPDGTQISVRNNIALTNPTASAVPTLVPKDALSRTFSISEVGYGASVGYFPVGVYKFEIYDWYKITGSSDTATINGISRTLVNLTGATFSSNTIGLGDISIIKLINLSGVEENRYIGEVIGDEDFSVTQAFSEEDFPNTTECSLYAGYLTTVYLLVTTEFLKCFQPKIAKISMKEKSCCPTCKTSDIEVLSNMLFGLFSIDAQFKSGLYDAANKNIAALYKICQAEDCKC